MTENLGIDKAVVGNPEFTLISDVESNGDDQHGFIPPTDKEIKKLLWKMDLRMVPWLGILYLCSFLDRVNIGNAKLAGLQTDLHVSDDAYNWALSIFFIGYILFEIPSNMMLKTIGPKRWIPLVMLSWGLVMLLMSQAGLFPGVIFYLSLWYTRQEQATRIAIFFSCATVAGAFGGALSYGIMQMDGIQNMAGWQWIFTIEAIPTILISIATYFILPDLPHRAKFINKRERAIVIHRLTVDAGPSTETHFSWKQFWSVFTDWKVYMHIIIYICGLTPLYSLSLFLPSIIKGMGYTDLAAQAMSAPPYAIACFFTIIVALHADKKRERGFHIAIPTFIGAIGYLLLILLRDRGATTLFIASIITTTGVFAHMPVVVSWYTGNLGGHTKRGVAIAFIISLGTVGGAIAGQLYRNDDAPYYSRGHEICLGLLRRDNLTPDEYAKESSGEDLCDFHPDFRYIT
ncbi:major facilitator superfamily domain-containing protein [Chlamydoabsidia padenii]|nr:major facilitator superfamily domain-containing protein [Chlamydoabsidia padenii]